MSFNFNKTPGEKAEREECSFSCGIVPSNKRFPRREGVYNTII